MASYGAFRGGQQRLTLQSEAVAATVLVDPQGFLDGTPPVPERYRWEYTVIFCTCFIHIHLGGGKNKRACPANAV